VPVTEIAQYSTYFSPFLVPFLVATQTPPNITQQTLFYLRLIHQIMVQPCSRSIVAAFFCARDVRVGLRMETFTTAAKFVKAIEERDEQEKKKGR
jgi:hypothetical protein